MKRSKEKKEELKRDLGGTELVDLPWEVYYKKVNSSFMSLYFSLFFSFVLVSLFEYIGTSLTDKVFLFHSCLNAKESDKKY